MIIQSSMTDRQLLLLACAKYSIDLTELKKELQEILDAGDGTLTRDEMLTLPVDKLLRRCDPDDIPNEIWAKLWSQGSCPYWIFRSPKVEVFLSENGHYTSKFRDPNTLKDGSVTHFFQHNLH